MQEVLTVFLSKWSKFWAQKNKLYCIKIVALSAAISTHNNVMFGTKRFNITLTSKWSKSWYNYLFDVHRNQPGSLQYFTTGEPKLADKLHALSSSVPLPLLSTTEWRFQWHGASVKKLNILETWKLSMQSKFKNIWIFLWGMRWMPDGTELFAVVY